MVIRTSTINEIGYAMENMAWQPYHIEYSRVPARKLLLISAKAFSERTSVIFFGIAHLLTLSLTKRLVQEIENSRVLERTARVSRQKESVESAEEPRSSRG